MNTHPLHTTSGAHSLMPNLFVIGASKSGSSALHAYLNAHPQIAMSREKEPCFFVDQTELQAAWPIMARQPCSHEWEAYIDLWRGGEEARWRGEGSVYYSQSPHRSGVAERIHAKCPDARIVYVVREPVSRAIGHYWQRFKEFQERLPIEEAVKQNRLYLDSSDYGMQLDAYLAYFRRDQIHIILAEDLRAKRRETLTELIRWLELDEYTFSDEELQERHRSPNTSRKERFPFVAKVRNSAAWAWARQNMPENIVNKLRASATTEFEKAEENDTGARIWLAEQLAPKRAQFEKILGRPAPWDH